MFTFFFYLTDIPGLRTTTTDGMWYPVTESVTRPFRIPGETDAPTPETTGVC